MPVNNQRLLAGLLFLLLSFSFSYPLTTIGAGDEVPLHKDIHISGLNLRVDGSITPQLINVTGFPAGSWITRMIFNIHFADNDLDFDGWGAGAALANGTALLIEGVSFLGENLSTNHGFGHLSGDLTIFTDDKNPKNNHFVSRLAIFEIVPPWGIQWTNNESVQFLVQDDITAGGAAVSLLQAIVEGFSIPTVAKYVSDDPRLDLIGWLQNQYAFFIALIVVFSALLIFFKVIWPMLRM